ncbi:MAG: class I SAM-dependent methyltransferase, partial [Nitrososphaeraceae archaeon]
MNSNFCCPKCKSYISVTHEGYVCQNCDRVYFLQDGYVDFIGESEFYAGEVSKKQMEILIQEIDSLGYDEGITHFFKQNPSLQDYITNVRRIDWISHCLTKNNSRCLDIGSGLGNVSENLSYIYQEVYSLEAVKERIEFQKRRYKKSNRSNVVIVRSNALELPFPDNYFDLVVCNGVLEWVGMMNSNMLPREAQLSFLQEIKRVLSSSGYLYVGIENRFGLPLLLGAKDHSGLPYTSLLPRRLANLVVKKFGYTGGIYGDKSTMKKEEKGYYTYTYSIWGYWKLFGQAGFKFKSYWVVPGYNEPYFSGNLEDKIGLKAFIEYQRNIVKRFKILFSLMEKMPKFVISLMTSLLCPSFLFYCYKNELKDTVDDLIVRNTGLESFFILSDANDIKYILFD